MMKTSFKTLLAISAAALLMACGGGGVTSPITQNQIPNPATNASFTNAGVFVPSNATTATFNLVNCKYSGGPFNSVNAGTATLIISANGNMTLAIPEKALWRSQRFRELSQPTRPQKLSFKSAPAQARRATAIQLICSTPSMPQAPLAQV